MSGITVWDKGENFCPQCIPVKKKFDQAGVDYQTKDITADEHAEQLAKFKEQGLAQTPIVQTPTETWAGPDRDKIEKAIDEFHASQQATIQSPSVGGPGLS